MSWGPKRWYWAALVVVNAACVVSNVVNILLGGHEGWFWYLVVVTPINVFAGIVCWFKWRGATE